MQITRSVALPEPLAVNADADYDATFSLAGLGAVGQEVAIRLEGFGCEVLYTKRHRLPEESERALGVRHARLDEVLRADIVSLDCSFDASTRHMIARRELARMQTQATLINTARGGLVNEADPADALRDGVIRSFEIKQKPIAPDNPLLHLDNAILTPHIVANTADNLDREIACSIGNISRYAAG